MRIAILSPWAISKAAIGGTERFIIDLATGLSSSGHNVTVFMLSGPDQHIHGIKYKSLNILGSNKIADEYSLREKIGDFCTEDSFYTLANQLEATCDLSNFDVVHLNSFLFLKAWKNKRRIFTIHTNPFEYKQAWGDDGYAKMLDILRDEVKSNNVTLTAPSFYYAEKFGKLMSHNVHFIPHAIDATRLSYPTSKEKLLKKYDLSSEKTTLLLPSRLEPVQKRPQVLFEALSLLNKDKIQKLQVVSSGMDTQYSNYRQKLEQDARQHGISARFVHFDTIAEAYKLSDVVILPSRSESFGYAALESLTLGKITLLNQLPTFKEVGRGNPNAYFFEKTPDALAKLLNDFFDQSIKSVVVPKAWSDIYEIKSWIKRYEEIIE